MKCMENEFTLKMFENYPQPDWYVPDNRPKPKICPKEELVIGGTAIHTFSYNFKYSRIASRFQIIYKQSITEVVVIDSEAFGSPYELFEIDEKFEDITIPKTYINVTLSPSTTEKFNRYDKLFVQTKFFLKDGSVIYFDVEEVVVKDTIDDKNRFKSE